MNNDEQREHRRRSKPDNLLSFEHLQPNDLQIQSSDVESDYGFIEFWDVYPRKTGRFLALKCWRKLKPSALLRREIIRAVKMSMKVEWKDRALDKIPHASTFINQVRWEDFSSDVDVDEDIPTKMGARPGVHLCRWCDEEHEWICRYETCTEYYLACRSAHWRLIGRYKTVTLTDEK